MGAALACLLWPIGIIIGLVIVFVPAIIAWQRGSIHMLWIALLCLLAGWTGVGWVAAFVWAVVGPTEQQRATGNWSDQFRRDADYGDPVPRDWQRPG